MLQNVKKPQIKNKLNGFEFKNIQNENQFNTYNLILKNYELKPII